MTFLVDANVLSEATKAEPVPSVVAWLVQNESRIVVDPIILGEIRFGILTLAEGRRRRRLARWFAEGVEHLHCLPWEAHTGLRWAELVADLRARGLAMPIKDSMIAATALRFDLPLATRNRKDFEKAGIEIVDPFSSR